MQSKVILCLALVLGGIVFSATIAKAQPVITNQPATQAVLVGTNVTFSVGVSGTGPFSYQWLSNNDNVAYATNSTLALTNVQLASAGNYSVVVTN